MSLPSITIVTPSLNQAETLERTICSVLDQGYEHLEYIVMDGGSTDSSAEIIARYAGRLTFWQSCADGGQTAAINAGFAHGSGEVMAWLNSDDWYVPGALRQVGEFFRDNPDAGWVSGAAELVNSRGKTIKRVEPTAIEPVDFACWGKKILFQPATFWRRDLWRKVGPLAEEWQCAMDFDLWLRLRKVARPHPLPVLLARSLVTRRIKTYRLAARMHAEIGLALARNGYFEEAVRYLARPIRRALAVQRMFSVVTRNRFYRRWRDRREEKRPQ